MLWVRGRLCLFTHLNTNTHMHTNTLSSTGFPLSVCSTHWLLCILLILGSLSQPGSLLAHSGLLMLLLACMCVCECVCFDCGCVCCRWEWSCAAFTSCWIYCNLSRKIQPQPVCRYRLLFPYNFLPKFWFLLHFFFKSVLFLLLWCEFSKRKGMSRSSSHQSGFSNTQGRIWWLMSSLVSVSQA